ncbi:aminopeptidase P family protein [Candidatus Bipolaricaulota bacterium]|nr:aminopeptidase P family protein [Candidatus Bipolaricaulota bacterium]
MFERNASPSAAPLSAWNDKVLPLRRQWAERDHLLAERLETLLPGLMAREEIDLWIVLGNEYNEDPVFDSLTPASVLNASRSMILLFSLREDGTVERSIIGPYGIGDLYERVDGSPDQTQAKILSQFVLERDPQIIGINRSSTFPLADGLSHTAHEWLIDALGSEFGFRVRSAERLAVGWLETRSATELEIYPHLVDLSRAIIRTAFSSLVITPGITTTDDVVWWMRQQVHNFGLKPAFPFTISLDAREQAFDIHHRDNARNRILQGDTLRCDFGITYLGLTTDIQESVYVLRPGENEPPAGLQAAMAAANCAQDIVAEVMALGRSGNEMLAAARERAVEQGLDACFFCHPIGTHVHGAGLTIGRWNNQEGLPGSGEWELHDGTCYAIELYIKHVVAEWDGREFMMVLEQDAAFADGRFRWLSGRQTRFLTL